MQNPPNSAVETLMQTLPQRLTLVAGGFAAIGLLSVSAASNFQAGLLLSDGLERYVYAGAGAFLDLLKTLLPMAVAAGVAARAFVRVSIGIVLFAAISIYSRSCAIGLYSIAKNERLGDVKAEQNRYERLTRVRDEIRGDLDQLDVNRSPGAIRAEIEALKHDHKYDRSRQCTNATVQSSRQLCARIRKAEAQLKDAEKAERLRSRMRSVEASLAGLDLQKALSKADPAAEAVARITGHDPGTVRHALALMIAALIEAGSGFGFWLTSILGRAVGADPGQKGAPGGVRGPREAFT